MQIHGVSIPEAAIGVLCRRHRIARLSFFGSILRDDFDAASDVDILVAFQPGVRLGLLGFVAIARELEALIGRRVDLREAEDLSYLFRNKILRVARLVLAA